MGGPTPYSGKITSTAVREALRGLEAVGLIEVQKGSGRYLRQVVLSEIIDLAYTLELSSSNLVDLLEIRGVLEMQFIEKAIESLDESDIADLGVILHEMEDKMEKGQSFAKEDMEFHKCIFSKVDNQLLQELLDIFWRLFTEALPEELKLPDHNGSILQHHIELYDSIKQSNGPLAKNQLKGHFGDVMKRLQVK